MSNSSFSSFEDLNAALLSQNPFAKPPFLNASDVWGNEFFDVETINAHASDAVFHALDQIRAGQYPTTSIAITAQDGTGKTHIISRIRHRLQQHGGGLFVYANKYGNIGQIKQSFQRILAESLGKIGRGGVRQWQELATAMANNALQIAQSNARVFSTQEFLEKFNNGTSRQTKRWVNELTRAFLQAKSVNDPDIVKAILWTLSEEQSLYAIKWLEGQELAQYKANELELPSQCQSFEAVLQILDLISQYNELVICFDELDTPGAYDDISGLHISQIVASFIKDLFQNLNRGLILSVMMPAQWSDKIRQLPGGVFNKVSAYGNPIDLKYMDGQSIVNLVGFWLDKYYQNQNLIPPEPIYPFTQIQLSELGQGRPTVREVLKWCKDHCKPPVLNPTDNNQDADISNPVELAFIKELEEDVGNSLEDNYLLADAILFGFQSLIGQTVERVTIQSATDRVTHRGRKDDYINFKVIGKDNGTDVSIGVAVLQYAGGRGLGAGLRRLNDYETFNLTRGCLVRSKSRRITSYLEQQYLVPLIKQQGGEYVELKEEEIKPLLAIRSVHQKREVDYGVSEEEIFNFIAEKGAEKMLGASNPLLTEILSDPSYQVPTDLIEDEPVAVAESIMDDLSDSEQLDQACENLIREFN
ncbi:MULTISPECIES: P-loop NTPase fold protein [unclassified Microcoleus]|uniref:P-loop NTPase fold protein n=1 Tax=unclassified Microcoleus TaxID=2642155 RepID=UPI0025D56AED|nr:MULTISPECIES: P-loop NTPase fold protein [unclassified Microcoleus]